MSAPLDLLGDVVAFQEAIGHGSPPAPTLAKAAPRQALIREEFEELVEALTVGDMHAVIKEICDLLYVTLGTVVELGIDLSPFWDAVHASNMAKTDGTVWADGKVQKPEGWRPPDIKALLERQVSAAAEGGE